MITLKQAKSLKHGQILYHVKHKNSDGTAQRWRVSGLPKTWKTMPERVEIPVKHGMYDNDRLTQDDLHLVTLKEPKPIRKKSKLR